ncbi:MAG: hypothetical protein IJV75_00195 [Alphaproteobacteria bacterium]|nr:hypothetical protein [Alphaproteobacteria bacterium]
MLETIKLRLQSLGYEIIENDDFTLNFLIKKVEQHIKHFCNIDTIPDCLESVMVDMVCGEFLQGKKTFGQLTSIQIEPIIKKIQDGNTTTEFSSTVDAEALFNTYVDKLINGHNLDLIRHRKLVW